AACFSQTASASEPSHFLAPAVHESVHEATHWPFEQTLPLSQGNGSDQSRQPENFLSHFWVPKPEQMLSPRAQRSTHLSVHTPPEQTAAFWQAVTVADQSVQPPRPTAQVRKPF